MTGFCHFSYQRGSLSLTWMIWIAGSLATSFFFGMMIFGEKDQTMFMPGPLSSGHHQLAESCGSCHTSKFGGDEVLHNACIECHGEERDDDIDTHPISKFEDPRNADRLEKIDATYCVTCHVEHQPAITLADGVTQPKDVCMHCHSEIAEERSSHVGLGFETCASSGCHNYHDNRALYTKFVLNRTDDGMNLSDPLLLEKDFGLMISELADYPHDRHPVVPLTAAQMDASSTAQGNDLIEQEWLASSHALSGVNCSACHLLSNEDGTEKVWLDKPGMEACGSCHGMETELFGKGKHGMRAAAGLSPMTPAMSRLQMQPEAEHDELSCASCHGAHEFNVVTAAVEACEGCHADEHTVAYRQSAHYALWLAEIEGSGEPGSGVSCASCHLPRENMEVNDWTERVVVNHNQNATLSPNSKMLRPVCLSCHGLEFSINALADKALIDSNFNALPTAQVQSVNMARALKAEHERKRAARRINAD